MNTIDSTPNLAERVYARMEATLRIARKHVARPLTLAEKLLLSHLDDPSTSEPPARGQTVVHLRADRVLLQDVLGQTAMLQFMQARRTRSAVPTTIHCDHLIQARVEGRVDLAESLAENDEVYRFLRTAAAKYGVGFWGPGAGIIHQVNFERYAFPGELIVGTDSHTPMAGGLGALASGVGGADAVEVMAGLPWEVTYPSVIGVRLLGELNGWAAPKDVIVKLAGLLTVAGATNAIIEYFGPGARSLSATGKATIANMGAELGATTSVFPYDEHMATYLAATGRGELARLAEAHRSLLAADPQIETAPGRYYDRLVEIDLSSLEPHVAGPHSPDRARPISQLAAELRSRPDQFVDGLSTALIGSCTNSSYEDMSRAADVAEQARAHGLRSAVPLMVTPGSEQIRATIARDGQMASLEAIGATVLANACGPCIGQWRRSSSETTGIANTIVTSYNRNFPRRNDGQASTMNFIASPEIVSALAVAGRLSFNPLTDSLIGADGQPFRLRPPVAAPEVPPAGFDAGSATYIAPPADGSGIELAVDATSERLQLMQPWPAWDGLDLVDLPILLKASGRTTTDHIAPAGPWLRYRGHLEHFSEAMFLGANNAYSDAVGTGVNVVSGEVRQRLSHIAREYRARGLRWVVVGDENYGEGSSREHAALAPRLLGCAAVMARSFARIHESNLKKQGVLALTFADPADYARPRADDRVSLVGLQSLSEGRPVECVLGHADGTTETLWLRHSYTSSQLDWFRLGSALNVLAGQAA